MTLNKVGIDRKGIMRDSNSSDGACWVLNMLSEQTIAFDPNNLVLKKNPDKTIICMGTRNNRTKKRTWTTMVTVKTEENVWWFL